MGLPHGKIINVSSPKGHSWEGITSLDPRVTHGKILRSLHLLKTVIESQRSALRPYSMEGFTLVTTHVSHVIRNDHVLLNIASAESHNIIMIMIMIKLLGQTEMN